MTLIEPAVSRHHKPWSLHEDEVITSMLSEGSVLTEIAAALGRTLGATKARHSRLQRAATLAPELSAVLTPGIDGAHASNKYKAWAPSDDELLWDGTLLGRHVADMAVTLGRTVEATRMRVGYLRRNNKDLPPAKRGRPRSVSVAPPRPLVRHTRPINKTSSSIESVDADDDAITIVSQWVGVTSTAESLEAALEDVKGITVTHFIAIPNDATYSRMSMTLVASTVHCSREAMRLIRTACPTASIDKRRTTAK